MTWWTKRESAVCLKRMGKSSGNFGEMEGIAHQNYFESTKIMINYKYF